MITQRRWELNQFSKLLRDYLMEPDWEVRIERRSSERSEELRIMLDDGTVFVVAIREEVPL